MPYDSMVLELELFDLEKLESELNDITETNSQRMWKNSCLQQIP